MMLQYGLCFAIFVLSAVRTKQNENQLDGSRGLKRGVHVQGNRVSVGSSIVVSNYRECALSCVNTPPCSSFNVASSPRSDGKYRCELLMKISIRQTQASWSAHRNITITALRYFNSTF